MEKLLTIAGKNSYPASMIHNLRTKLINREKNNNNKNNNSNNSN